MRIKQITISLSGEVISEEILQAEVEIDKKEYLKASTLLMTGMEPKEILKEFERRTK